MVHIVSKAPMDVINVCEKIVDLTHNKLYCTDTGQAQLIQNDSSARFSFELNGNSK